MLGAFLLLSMAVSEAAEPLNPEVARLFDKLLGRLAQLRCRGLSRPDLGLPRARWQLAAFGLHVGGDLALSYFTTRLGEQRGYSLAEVCHLLPDITIPFGTLCQKRG